MKELTRTLARICHYAQEHIDDKDAWDTSTEYRRGKLECVSYVVSCFLAQNTVRGDNGVEYDVVLDILAQHPMRSEDDWIRIIGNEVESLGGIRASASPEVDSDNEQWLFIGRWCKQRGLSPMLGRNSEKAAAEWMSLQKSKPAERK